MDTIYRKQKSFLIVLASIILIALVTLKGPPEVHAETRHYNDEETVTNLTSIQGNKVDMIAQWSQVSVTLPEGKKPGYKFIAWYQDPECTKYIGKANDTYIPARANETLYAKWTAIEYTLHFDTNLDHTETGRYAIGVPTGDTSDKKIIFDDLYGELPEIALDGYEFLGWYDKPVGGNKINSTDRFTYLNDDQTDGSDMTLYAHWKNFIPANVKMYAKNDNGIYVTSDDLANDVSVSEWSDTAYTLWAQAEDIGDGIANATVTRADAYSNAVFDRTTFNKVTRLTKENATFQSYGVEGTTSIFLTVSDTEGTKTDRILDGSVSTKKMNLKVDTTAPKATMSVTLGTHENPLNTVSTKSWQDWAVYDSVAYGAKVTITISDENEYAAGGKQDVSGISHAWLTVFDTDNPDNKTDIELVADGSNNVYTYDYEDILKTNIMFPNVMNLSYELHVVDVAGNETPVITKTTERKPELYSKVEKLTSDDLGDPLLFKAGFRGRLYIYTTGWVDTLSLEWPDCIVKSGEYDVAHDEPGMIYNATLITNGMTQDMTPSSDPFERMLQEAVLTSEYTDDNNPSSKTITVEADGENTGFTRCYVFDFWVPVYIGLPENPDHIDMGIINQITTKIIANKYLIRSSAESVTTETVTSMGTFDMRLGEGSIMDDFHTSIIN